MLERQNREAETEGHTDSEDAREIQEELSEKIRGLRMSVDRIRSLESVQAMETSIPIGVSDLETNARNLKVELETSEQKKFVAETTLATSERFTADLRKANKFWMSQVREVTQFSTARGSANVGYGGEGAPTYGAYNPSNLGLDAQGMR